MKSVFLVALLGLGINACTTLDNDKGKEAPVITESMTYEELTQAAIDFGGVTLDRAKQMLRKRHQLGRASSDMLTLMLNDRSDQADARFMNAMQIYMSGSDKASIRLFEKLVQSPSESMRVLGWNLAANMPSVEIAKAMDAEFTRRVLQSEESILLVPQMAHAIQSNRMTSGYTILRLGLLEKGDDEYAKAMIAIAPRRVGDDFLTYLAKANADDLRQLNQRAVNMYTCLVILRYFATNAVPMANPQLPVLFLYSVSRNPALADLGSIVVERLIHENQGAVAALLAQHPAWVQVAFIEGARQRKIPGLTSFLGELKDNTTFEEVTDEIETQD